MRAHVVLVIAVTTVLGVAGAAFAAGVTPGPSAYAKPPFAKQCKVHQFGEGVAPDLNRYPDDPLCLEYQKRDITVDTGER